MKYFSYIICDLSLDFRKNHRALYLTEVYYKSLSISKIHSRFFYAHRLRPNIKISV